MARQEGYRLVRLQPSVSEFGDSRVEQRNRRLQAEAELMPSTVSHFSESCPRAIAIRRQSGGNAAGTMTTLLRAQAL